MTALYLLLFILCTNISTMCGWSPIQRTLIPLNPLNNADSLFQLSDSFAINVLNYGANGNDSSFDNTEPFQKALNASFAMGGTLVYVPSGHYYFNGIITIPAGVSLIGTYLTAPIHTLTQSKSNSSINDISDGTVLAPLHGRGLAFNDSKNSFVTLKQHSVIRGMVIFYPDVVCQSGVVPVSYPPTIYASAADITIQNIELLNSWIGIYAVGAARHFIARVTGQPIKIGIYVDECYDIGRIENVQFKSNYCHEPSYWKVQQFYGTSFVLGRTDWEYMFNTFSWGYAIGYSFIETDAGSPSGNFLGIGSDACNNVSVNIESVKKWGIVITNGEFVAMRNTQLNSSSVPVAVLINEDKKGSIQFVNCMFWGGMQYISQVNGDCSVSFSNCQMQEWDVIYNNDSAAIQVNNGIVKLIGNNFYLNKPQCYFRNGTQKGIVVGNSVAGNVQIKQDVDVDVTIMGNL